MRSLRMLVLGTLLLVVGAGLWGCSSSEPKDEKGTLNTTAPINDSAPEAKSAPAAPTDPSIIYPGGKKKSPAGAPK